MRYKDKNKKEQRKKQAYEFFISKGLTPVQASAMIGNAIVESGLNTRIEGDKHLDHASVGTFQWRGDRLKRLKKRYEDPYSFENQLDFAWWELQNTHRHSLKALQQANTPEEAAIAVRSKYEVAIDAHDDRRIKNTLEVLSQFNPPPVKRTLSPIQPTIQRPEVVVESTKTKQSIVTPQVINFGKLPETTNLVEKPKENKQTQQAKQNLDKKQNEYKLVQDILSKKIKPIHQSKTQVTQDTVKPFGSYILNKAQELGVFQEGGEIKLKDRTLKEINPYSSGDRYLVNSENIEQSRNKIINYLNSPGFLRIAENNKYNPEKLKNERLKKAKDVNIDIVNSIGTKPGLFDGIYSLKDKKIKVEPFISKGIVEHEINHATTEGLEKLNDFTKEEISKRVSDNIMNYYNSPDEVQTRVVNSRLLLENSNVWDYNKEEFNEKHLEKLKKDLRENPDKYRIQDFIDLIEHVNSDEDFIWLMNNIAQVTNDENINLAERGGYYQEGGEISAKDFVQNWFNNPITRERLSSNLRNYMQAQSLINRGLTNTENIQLTQYPEHPTKGAEYTPGIISQYGKPTKEELVHEYTHGFEGLDRVMTDFIIDKYGTPLSNIRGTAGVPQTESLQDTISKQFNIDTSTIFGKDKVKKEIEHGRYLRDKGELYPRFMEMRSFLNVKPGQEIKDEDIEKLQKDETMNKMFKYYRPETVKEILNTVAFNNNQIKNNTQIT